MADHAVPHFHNEPGEAVIDVGSKEFMCIGARPPFDHPHIFCDMGDDNEIICEYCSTLFRYDPTLGATASRPAGCSWMDPQAA
ncbi:zinc-finger domain-containing protein [Pseudorhodoplanes sp.]|uniref:zinc-finger domain-containing protein n=1 Tax=Pseudorhodoplanes sp. TaxID=1934341 RepID=UPI003D0D6BC1